MYQLVYTSETTVDSSSADLRELLAVARAAALGKKWGAQLKRTTR